MKGPLNPKTILFILLGLFAFFMLCKPSGFKSTFGATATTTIVVPPNTGTIDIPIEDTTGNNMGGPSGSNQANKITANGVLTVTLTPKQYTDASDNPTVTITGIVIPPPPSVTGRSAIVLSPQITYRVNNETTETSVALSTDRTVDQINTLRRTTCITATNRAMQGYPTDVEWANAQCKAFGFSRGSDGVAISCSPGAGNQYTCKADYADVILKNTYTSAANITISTFEMSKTPVTIPENAGITSVQPTVEITIKVPNPGYVIININGNNYNYLYNPLRTSAGMTPVAGIKTWTVPTSGSSVPATAPANTFELTKEGTNTRPVILLPSSRVTVNTGTSGVMIK